MTRPACQLIYNGMGKKIGLLHPDGIYQVIITCIARRSNTWRARVSLVSLCRKKTLGLDERPALSLNFPSIIYSPSISQVSVEGAESGRRARVSCRGRYAFPDKRRVIHDDVSLYCAAGRSKQRLGLQSTRFFGAERDFLSLPDV